MVFRVFCGLWFWLLGAVCGWWLWTKNYERSVVIKYLCGLRLWLKHNCLVRGFRPELLVVVAVYANFVQTCAFNKTVVSWLLENRMNLRTLISQL